MEKVLARREVNRQTLQQYILDDVETFEILGPGRMPVFHGKREFTWYERDGMHVRSPVKFDGVVVGEKDRREYEENWIRRERARLENSRKRGAAKNGTPEASAETSADATKDVAPVPGESPVPAPRFVSEAYFMDFKFDPGNYYLAGREQLEGKQVLRIEYYPTQMFRDDDGGGGEARRDRKKEQSTREQRTEADIERKMNKTALVTLWVDPAEYQIVKYTFDNVWMDFLPGAWLVRVDDIHASMTMGQPFEGVWLPRNINVHAGVSLASGPFEATYNRQFANYKLGEVKSIIRIPKRELTRSAPSVPRGLSLPELPEVHGPAVSEAEQAPEIVREIRVHGNAAVPDEEVVRLAGVAVGQAVPAEGVTAIEQRLKQSGRFESVEVRKRYRSLTDASDVALVLLVHEKPGVTLTGGVLGRARRPFGRLSDRLMFLPIVSYSDGYGFTYGGRVSTRDALGFGEHLSVPLTWGGTRRAALELDRTFERGPITRVASSVAISRRENPRFEIGDRRVEVRARAERQLVRIVRTGVETSRSSIDFGGTSDRLWTFGADAALDTRADPKFPRNAVFAGVGWTGLHLRSAAGRIDRFTTDLRGYVGVFRQIVLAGRTLYTAADAPLPPYERLLLGGASTLRGFRAGSFDGDRLFASSAELRVPLTSVLSTARLGVTGFMDAAKTYDSGTRLADARWHKGLGAGLFLIAPFVSLNLDIAHGLKDGDTRLHFAAGFSF